MANKPIQQLVQFIGELNLSKQSESNLKGRLRELFGNVDIAVSPDSFKKQMQPIINALQSQFKNFDAGEILNLNSNQAIIDKIRDSILDLSSTAQSSFANIDNGAFDDMLKQLKLINNYVKSVAAPSVKGIGELGDAADRLKQKTAGIEKTLRYTGKASKGLSSMEHLANLANQYNQSVMKGDPWEVQYQHMLKYIRAYETAIKLQEKQFGVTGAQQWQEGVGGQFTTLYNQLSSQTEHIVTSLQNVVNRINGDALVKDTSKPWAKEVTLQQVLGVLKGGLKVNTDNKQGNSTQSNVQPNVQAPAKKNDRGIIVYRGIYEPDDYEEGKVPSLSRKEYLEKYWGGGEIWTNKREVAETYTDGMPNPVMLQGTIKPTNLLTIDAGGHEWNEFLKMSDLESKLPELFNRIKADEFNTPEDIQTELNRVAKSMGHDAVEMKNVIDTNNPDSYKALSSTYSVLNDSILSISKAYKTIEQDAEGITTFASKGSKADIPEYYQTPDESQVHQENANAINAEAQAQEKLNGIENQNPKAQDESSIHNANADAIQNEIQSQEQLAEKIKTTQALIQNQQAWLKTLDPYLNDDSYKTSGKKAATEQLKNATDRLVNYRMYPEEAIDQNAYGEEKRIVAWNRAYQEAQRQGVAQSTLTRNYTDADLQYETALQTLQKEREYRAQVLQEEQKELQVLQQQFDAQNQLNSAKTNDASIKVTQEELGIAQKTTLELEKQQKLLLYRRVEGKVDLNRVSGRSGDALYDKQGQSTIQDTLEMGFGGYGDGLYGSVFSSAQNLIPRRDDGPVSFFEFDASAYNLYINKTAEQAEALRTFLLSLQKLVGDGSILDASQLTDIASLSEEQLFQKAQQIFNDFSMTKEQFHTWLENAKVEASKIAGLLAKGEVPADFHNFGTRFMKTLGYQGVLNQTGDVEYDGNEHGSVIYDPKDDIKQSARVFDDEKEFAAYIKAQTQAHQENATAMKAETQAQENLNKAKAQQVQIEQGDNDGAKVAEENAKTDAINRENDALKENINLKAQTNGQGVVTGGTGTGGTGAGTTLTKVTPTQTVPDGATTGEVTQLEAVRAKVLEVANAVNTKNKAFYDEATIVGQAVGKENAALISLRSNIEAIISAVNIKNKAFYDEAVVVGQAIGKENAALISLQSNVNNVTTSLGGTLSNLQGISIPNLSNTASQTNIANEAQALANLRASIDEVTTAVQTKTASFTQEETMVVQSVNNEIAALDRLRQIVDNVNTAVSTLTQGLNNTLNNAGAFNGINLNVNATVDLTAIETTLANILTAIPNAGVNAQNNNAGGGQGGAGNGGQGGNGGRAGDLAGRITVQASMLDNFEAKLMDIGQLTPNVQAQINQLRTALNNVADAPGLTVWMNQFKTMRADMNTAGIISDLDTLGQMATRLGQLRAKSAQAASSEERASWDALIQQQEAAMQHMQQGAGVDQDWLDNRAREAYNRSMEKYNDLLIKAREKERKKDVVSAFNEEIKKSVKEAGVNKSESVASRATETLISANQIQGISPEQQANLNAYQSKILELKNTIANFPKDGPASETQKNQLISQRLEVDAYTKEIQELIANYERLSGENATVFGTSSLGSGASADAYQKELTQTIMAQTQGRASIKSYDAETRTLTYTLRTGKGEFTQYAASVRQADGALVSVRGTTTRAMGVFESIGKKIKEYSYYFTGSMMIYRVIAWVREGVTAVKEIDTALTELKKVTDETEESYDRFLDTAAKTAEKVGSTIKDVVSSTADWARLIYLGLLYGDI